MFIWYRLGFHGRPVICLSAEKPPDKNNEGTTHKAVRSWGREKE